MFINFPTTASEASESLRRIVKRSVVLVETEARTCWDGSLLWPSEIKQTSLPPNIRECVQQSALIFAPAALFWLLVPIFSAQIWRVRQRPGKSEALLRSRLFLAKIMITALLAVDAGFLFFRYFDAGDFYAAHFPVAAFFSPLVRVATMLGLFQCQRLCRRNGLVTSGIIHVTWIVHGIAAVPELYSWCQKLLGLPTMEFSQPEAFDVARLGAFAIWFIGIWTQVFLYFFADPRLAPQDASDAKRSPELDASFFSRLLLCWFNPILKLGRHKELAPDDLFSLNEGSKVEHLLGMWERFWTPTIERYNKLRRTAETEAAPETLLLTGNGLVKQHKQKQLTTKRSPNSYSPSKMAKKATFRSSNEKEERFTPPEPPSIVWNLFQIFRWQLIASAFVKILADCAQFLNPMLLKALIDYAEMGQDEPLWKGLFIALAMFSAAEFRSFAMSYYFYQQFRISVNVQAILTAAVYKKTLRLSSSARRDRTVGEVVNLMAIDVERYATIIPQMQQLWSSPLQIFIALVLLLQLLGVAAIPGFVLMAIFIPLSVYSTRFTRNWQLRQMRFNDERSRLCSELFNGIRLVKLYAWEQPMMDRIERIRRRELRELMKSSFVRALIDTVNFTSPMLVAVSSFLSYTLLGHQLTPAVAFVSLTLFNQIRSPMAMIGFLINQSSQWVVSNKRLKQFFVEQELSADDDRDEMSGGEGGIENLATKNEENDDEPENERNRRDEVISIRQADFAWDDPLHHSASSAAGAGGGNLSGVNLQISRGELVMVLGRVGSGKSSLLSALLGEMHRTAGVATVRGQIAYVTQSPWIRNKTLRENILFGSPFDRDLYDRVVESCALLPDLELLQFGDQTEIGERGVNLSGGQKARISLARAAYQLCVGCDLYLLDDPLSAVDAHVGQVLFDRVIGNQGLLAGVTRVLVTHSASFLAYSDRVIIMQDGRVAEMGTYEELSANKTGRLYRILNSATTKESTATAADTFATTAFASPLRKTSAAEKRSATAGFVFSSAVASLTTLTEAADAAAAEPSDSDDNDDAWEEIGIDGAHNNNDNSRKWSKASATANSGHHDFDDEASIYARSVSTMMVTEEGASAAELAAEHLRLSGSRELLEQLEHQQQHSSTPAPAAQAFGGGRKVTRHRSSDSTTTTHSPVWQRSALSLTTNKKKHSSVVDRDVRRKRHEHSSSGVSPTTTPSVAAAAPAAAGGGERGEESSTSESATNGLIEKENVTTGKVQFSIYFHYIRSAGIFFALFLIMYACNQTLVTCRGFWLSAWSEDSRRQQNNSNDINATTNASFAADELQHFRVAVYIGIGLAEAVCFFLGLIALSLAGLTASRRLHTPLLETILHAPIQFFDTTPVGRLLNRFGKDIDVLDTLLPLNTRFFINCAAQIIAAMTTIVISVPMVLIVIIPLFVIYFLILTYYVPTSRQLKRLESVHRSPLYSHFAETIQGVPTIRAFRRSPAFCAEMLDRINELQRIRYLNAVVAIRWLAVRLEFIGCSIAMFTALFGVLSNRLELISSAGMIGLAIAYAFNVTDFLNFAVRQMTELETNMVSVERLQEFLHVQPEAPWEGPQKPPKGWPHSGALCFEAYSTRYRPGLDLTLRQISLTIASGERLGVVGRTGAGKSTLAQALFRMVEPSGGRIVIDGVDIATIGFHQLRSALTIIPQDPVLFSGTLRFNLDPFERFTDADLWHALELSHLHAFVSELPEGLDHRIDEGGENISLGQRQLVCLARALLRRSRILVLDEATASVDLTTDSLVQATVRREFATATVLTIAHRLPTVLDCHRVCVLDRGRVLEVDTPVVLVSRGPSQSRFAAMLSASEQHQTSSAAHPASVDDEENGGE